MSDAAIAAVLSFIAGVITVLVAPVVLAWIKGRTDLDLDRSKREDDRGIEWHRGQLERATKLQPEIDALAHLIRDAVLSGSRTTTPKQLAEQRSAMDKVQRIASGIEDVATRKASLALVIAAADAAQSGDTKDLGPVYKAQSEAIKATGAIIRGTFRPKD